MHRNLLLATTISLLITAFAVAKNPTAEKPSLLWTAHLDGDADWRAAKGHFDSGSFPYPTVGFVGDKVLFAFQHWKDNLPGNTEEEYKVREFSLQNGQETVSHQWPVVHNRQRWDMGHLFFLGNRVLLFTGSSIAVYSKDWKLEWQRDFVGEVGVAPDGHVAFLRSSQPNQVTDTWIDTSSLAELSSSTHPLDHYNSVGDRKLAAIHLGSPPDKSNVLIRSDSSSWKKLCDCEGIPYFLNSRTLAVVTDKELLVLDESGPLLCKFSIGNKNQDTRAKPALQANRVVLGRGKGKVWPLVHQMGFSRDMAITVFDLDKKEQIEDVHLGVEDSRTMDFALSEDGTKLAILNGSTLDVYALPK